MSGSDDDDDMPDLVEESSSDDEDADSEASDLGDMPGLLSDDPMQASHMSEDEQLQQALRNSERDTTGVRTPTEAARVQLERELQRAKEESERLTRLARERADRQEQLEMKLFSFNDLFDHPTATAASLLGVLKEFRQLCGSLETGASEDVAMLGEGHKLPSIGTVKDQQFGEWYLSKLVLLLHMVRAAPFEPTC